MKNFLRNLNWKPYRKVLDKVGAAAELTELSN